MSENSGKVSPTKIGRSPAQGALAILIDYLGDDERVRAPYHDFKFRVVARFPANSERRSTSR